jgi:hypothetical protein
MVWKFLHEQLILLMNAAIQQAAKIRKMIDERNGFPTSGEGDCGKFSAARERE